MLDLVDGARSLAAVRLADQLPRRWSHVQAVANKATMAGRVLFAEHDAAVLAAAAWLHDIGYSPELVVTGFHPLDGARWLREEGFNPRVTALVAHHTCATIEADVRGLSSELAEFVDEASIISNALLFVDMTTGPDGQDLAVADRLVEIRNRYGPTDVVSRFVERAAPTILARAYEVELLLQGASS